MPFLLLRSTFLWLYTVADWAEGRGAIAAWAGMIAGPHRCIGSGWPYVVIYLSVHCAIYKTVAWFALRVFIFIFVSVYLHDK